MLSISKQIPTSADVDSSWIEWYKSMKQDFGKRKAKEAFSYIWSSRQSKIANTQKLRSYMDTQGVAIQPQGFVAHITQFGDDIIDRVGSVLRVGRTTFYIIGGVLVVAVGALVLQVAFQPFKTMKSVGQLSKDQGSAAKDVGGAIKDAKGL